MAAPGAAAHIAVIGGGFSGAAFAIQAARRALSRIWLQLSQRGQNPIGAVFISTHIHRLLRCLIESAGVATDDARIGSR